MDTSNPLALDGDSFERENPLGETLAVFHFGEDLLNRAHEVAHHVEEQVQQVLENVSEPARAARTRPLDASRSDPATRFAPGGGLRR